MLPRGDFNIVRFPSERSGAHPLNSQMLKFSSFISNHWLIDLQLSGAMFTWTNNQEIPSKSILDRFLLLSPWLDHLGVPLQWALPTPDSNHLPILLNHEDELGGPTPFHFEVMWLQPQDLKSSFINGGLVVRCKARQVLFLCRNSNFLK